MPHAMAKFLPGVDVTMTPVLNQAGVSVSELIRFMPDGRGSALIQKYGGWQKFYPNTIGSIVRALWAWGDTNSNFWLAVGAESQLATINSGVLYNITPATDTNNVAVSVSTTAGSNLIEITDTGSNITDYDSVWIKTQISVGGLILFGLYQAYQVGANTYNIYAYDKLGNPANAPTTVTNGGAVPAFTTTSGSSIVKVTLADHGNLAGDTFPVLVSTTVGGVTLIGNYIVTNVIDADNFDIQAATAATSSAGPTSMNGGNARYMYFIGQGPVAIGTGFGVGGFGVGGFGSGVTITPNPGTPIGPVTDWSLDNWGGTLIASYPGGPIFQWQPEVNPPTAYVIPNAPPVNDGFFVAMPERQIVAWGSTVNGVQDPLLVRWCEVQNYSQWIGLVTNQAGSYRMPRGSKVVGGLQGPQQGLIWTDLAVWAMQFIGGELVYGFNEIGNGCGLIGRRAAGVLNDNVYWMGQSQFFIMNGNGVEPLPCPVWDVVFQDLDTSNLNKIRCAPNSRFGEISWFYPTSGSGEVTSYVKYNAILNVWDYGTLQRTAWINQSVFGPPIGAKGSGYIYQHEMGNDDDTSPMTSYFQSGYMALNEADIKVFIDQVWPDMKWGFFDGAQTANIMLSFLIADYPGDTPIVYGPFNLTQATQFITPRFRARLMAIKIESEDIGSFWRMGGMRYRYAPDGKY